METIATQPIKKTADKTAYMREYKRKQYQENGDIIKERNKSYYYKYKFGLPAEDMKLYGNKLPAVAKIRKGLDELMQTNPDIVQSIIAMYIQTQLEQNAVEVNI